MTKESRWAKVSRRLFFLFNWFFFLFVPGTVSAKKNHSEFRNSRPRDESYLQNSGGYLLKSLRHPLPFARKSIRDWLLTHWKPIVNTKRPLLQTTPYTSDRFRFPLGKFAIFFRNFSDWFDCNFDFLSDSPPPHDGRWVEGKYPETKRKQSKVVFPSLGSTGWRSRFILFYFFVNFFPSILCSPTWTFLFRQFRLSMDDSARGQRNSSERKNGLKISRTRKVRVLFVRRWATKGSADYHLRTF